MVLRVGFFPHFSSEMLVLAWGISPPHLIESTTPVFLEGTTGIF